MQNKYIIPIEKYEKFDKKIEKLNKKALKLNLEKIKIEILGTEMYEMKNGLSVPCYKIEIIQNNQIIINGYEFMGKLERNIGDTFIYKGAEGVPASYKSIKTCQHCNTNRFRKYLYVLKNDKSEFITVGKSCLNDFVGHKDAETIIQYYQCVEDSFKVTNDDMFIEDFEIDDTYIPGVYSVDDVIRASIVSIKEYGYSRSSEEGITTKDDVYSILHRKNKECERLFRKSKEIPNKEVEDIKDFINNMDSNSDYIENLKLLISDGYVKENMLGYIVSIPYTVNKRKSEILKESIESDIKSKSDYIGEIGDKIESQVTFYKQTQYNRVSNYTGKYETVYNYMFLDENNNCILWNTTAVKDFDIGDKINLKGKIKSHKEYNGMKQTYVTRPACKFLNSNYKSKYIGEIGESIDLEVTCIKVGKKEFDENISIYTYEFIDKKNNCIIWDSKNEELIKINDKLKVSAKIKAHSEYKDTKQTFIKEVNFEVLK